MDFTHLQDNFPRVHRPSIDEFERIEEDVPFVITGLVSEWPAYKKWTTTYLKEKYGEGRACVRVMNKEGVFCDDQDMTLRYYIENMIEGDQPRSFYYKVYQDLGRIPGLSDDCETPEYIKKKLNIQGFWVSHRGVYSPLHYDPSHNLLAQVVGQKRLIIYRPNLSCMYHDAGRSRSRVDLMKPDHEKFPDFKFAQPLVCVLKAGEMLYLPACWWHHVISEDYFNISTNFFWRPSLGYQMSHSRYLLQLINAKFLTVFMKYYGKRLLEAGRVRVRKRGSSSR